MNPPDSPSLCSRPKAKSPCLNISGVLIAKYSEMYALAGCFRSQKGPQDWDGRGQPIQNEGIN